MTALPISDQQLLLTVIDGMPPYGLLPQCQTDFQKQIWQETREAYQAIHEELKAFFGGYKNQNSQKEYKLHARAYIELYFLIWEAWEELEKAAISHKIDIPKTPGEYLCKIIENDAISMVKPSLTYWEFNPKKLYQWSKFEHKIPLLKANNPTKKDLLKIKNHEAETRRMVRELGGDWKLWFLAMFTSTNSKNPDIKRALKIYNSTRKEISATHSAKLHPRKGVRGFGVVSGNQNPLFNLS